MEIKLYRASGQPIKPGHQKLYYEELNAKMDELEATLGKCTSDNAESYQEYMIEIHNMITEKYPNKGTIEYPTDPIAASKLCSKYGSIAFCIEDDEVVAYIMDA